MGEISQTLISTINGAFDIEDNHVEPSDDNQNEF